MTALYPLKFKTIFKDKIWGGQKIKTVLGKDFSPLPNCGETWEISGVAGNASIVRDGALEGRDLTSLLREYGGKLVGERVIEQYGETFPLLVKFIDANDDLSIQVHPDDKLAAKRHGSFGKTEMWYVFQADPGAKINVGFNRPLDKDQYLQFFNEKKLLDILNFVETKSNDVFFIPAGRVHSIGKGCLLAEIQQSSDITYRIYDFDRVDNSGKHRELHTEQALDAIDFTWHKQYKTVYQDAINKPVTLVQCPYFTTNKLHCTKPLSRDHGSSGTFVIYVCMEGALDLHYKGGSIEMKMGESVLVPAATANVRLEPHGHFIMLESFIT